MIRTYTSDNAMANAMRTSPITIHQEIDEFMNRVPSNSDA